MQRLLAKIRLLISRVTWVKERHPADYEFEKLPKTLLRKTVPKRIRRYKNFSVISPSDISGGLYEAYD